MNTLFENKNDRNESLTKLAGVFILFFTLFSIKLSFLPPFFDLRVVTMFFIMTYVVFKKIFFEGFPKTFKTSDIIFAAIAFFVLLYASIIVTVNGHWDSDKNVVIYIFNYLTFIVIFPYILTNFFKSDSKFANALIIATVIQSTIVILSFLVPSIKELLYQVQNIEEDRFLNRIVGLGIIGAKGSVYLFCGLIVNSYMILFKKYSYLYLVSFSIIFIAIALVGRTGFYLSLIIIGYTFLFSKKNIISIVKTIIYSSIIFILINLFINYLISYTEYKLNNELLIYTINRLDEIFGDSVTIERISDMRVPPLNLETFIGTGEIKGFLSSGLLIWHDSGYIQQYLSIGLFGSSMFYLTQFIYFVYLISKVNNNSKKVYFLLLLISLFVIEYKEPFIFALAYPFTLIMLLRLNIDKISYSEEKS